MELTSIFRSLLDLSGSTGVISIINKDTKKYLVTYSRNGYTSFLKSFITRYSDRELPKELLLDIDSNKIQIEIEKKDTKLDIKIYSLLKILSLEQQGFLPYSKTNLPISFRISVRKRKDPYLNKTIYDIYLVTGRRKSYKIQTCIGLESYHQFLNNNQIQTLIQKLVIDR